jgi:hypothetical protein
VLVDPVGLTHLDVLQAHFGQAPRILGRCQGACDAARPLGDVATYRFGNAFVGNDVGDREAATWVGTPQPSEACTASDGTPSVGSAS